MSSISLSSSTRRTGFWLLAGPAAVLVFVLFVASAIQTAAARRTVLEQARASEMAAESRALCEKWGVPAATPKHAECLIDIQSVRDRQAQRIAEDIEPM